LEKDRHRLYLAEHVAQFAPFDSVLDVGCGAGPAVLLLAKRLPGARIEGIDIHPLSVEAGNANLAKHGAGNATIRCGTADDLSAFASKSIDVAYTDGVLLYIGPDRIMQTVREMARVARKGLLFFEFHDPGLRGDQGILGKHSDDGFIRNFELLLKEFDQVASVSITKIPTEVFPTGRWPRYAHAIRATLRS
jgi:ubiquinone/menaquinone biosynthesis C-methylase UbiE